MINSEVTKQLKRLNDLLEDYLDNLDMEAVEEADEQADKKEKGDK